MARRWYRVSKATIDLFKANVRPGYAFEQTSRATDNPGWFDVPLSEDNVERLEKIRFAGETDDDLLTRVLLTTRQGVQ